MNRPAPMPTMTSKHTSAAQQTATDTAPQMTGSTRLALGPLFIGVAIVLLLTAYPQLATTADGRAHHLGALLLLWAMCAGLVRGVGFIPLHRLPRWLLSTPACLLGLVLACLQLIKL
jgi:predicted membrane protein